MKRHAHHVWHTIRGALLAILGLAAAYGLAQLLDGHGWEWQAGLGAVAFLVTVLTVGRYAFRMHPEDAAEEAAEAIRGAVTCAWALLLLALDFLGALLGTVSQGTTA